MNHVIFDVMNTRVTFKNIPIHELSKFAELAKLTRFAKSVELAKLVNLLN